MKAMTVDFGWERRAKGRLAGIALLAAAGVCAGYLGWAYLQLRAESAGWQADRQRFDRLAAAPRATDSPKAREKLQAELRFARQVIEKLDMPWDALFGAVETTYADQATLLGIEPDTERREVRLNGEAKDAAAMLGYLREVRRSPALREAHLTGHQVNAQDPQHPVRFTVQARWVELPPAPAEPAPVAEVKP